MMKKFCLEKYLEPDTANPGFDLSTSFLIVELYKKGRINKSLSL